MHLVALLRWTDGRGPANLAGALGAALLDSFRARDWLIPRSAPRALRLTTTGRQVLASHFDIDVSVLTNVWAVTAQAPSP
jgi:hypothetical protein